MRTSLILTLLLAVVGLLTAVPALALILGSLSEGIGAFGPFTLGKYLQAYQDPYLLRVALNTATFVLGASSLATALGGILAFLAVRTDLPGKRLVLFLPWIPMMIPHVLFAAAWIMLLNPTSGLINLYLQALLGLEWGPFNIYSLGGMILLEALLDLPIAFAMLLPVFMALDPSLEEAGRVSGARPLQVLVRVVLPLLRPALLGAFFLATIRTLGAFAIPQVVGIPAEVPVLTTYIFRTISTGWNPDYGKASALGVVGLVLAMVLALLYRRATLKGERFATVTGKAYRPREIPLGPWRWPVALLVYGLLLVLVLLPLATMAYISLLPYVARPGPEAWAILTWANWRWLFQEPVVARALANTAVVAAVAASLGVVLSLLVAYFANRYRSLATTLLDLLTFVSFAWPGLIIGVGFMLFFVLTPLYGSLWALILAFVAAYLPYGVRPLGSALLQIHKELEDAARTSGASFTLTLRWILVPLLAPATMSAWALLASQFVRELSVAAVLARPGSEVLAVLLLGYAQDGMWGRVAVLGLAMVALSTALLLAVLRLGTRRGPVPPPQG
ncbi:MAG: ABC transporter permease [Thermus sp.]|uniref:ABC transporter permease n=1 Tax=Thermus sp. TaxID=275 RepID=UPI00391D5F6A